MEPQVVRALIARCAAGDRRAGDELWDVVADAVFDVARHLARDHGLGPGQAEDLVQEFAVHLWERRERVLGPCRGTCVAQLRAFLRTTAARFLGRRLAARRRAAAGEAAALRSRPVPAAGPDEAQVELIAAEFAAIMAEDDRAAFAAMHRPDPPTEESDDASTRSRRTRCMELFQRYADRVV